MYTILPIKKCTKEKAIEAIGLKTFDYALPEQWVDHASEKLEQELNKQDIYSLIVSSFVWCYDYSKVFGSPYPLTLRAYLLLKKYDEISGSAYLDESKNYNLIEG